MIFNSRSVAFIFAAVICVSIGIPLSAYEVPNGTTFITLIICFVVTFVSAFMIFEVLVFKEFRKINKVFSRFNSVGDSGEVLTEKPVKRISAELLTFANQKEQEIEKLKKVEVFRREFLADISHELKTPVFAAQGFIHTLLDGAADDPMYRDRFLQKSAKALDQLNNLIQDLIVISQLETGEIKMHLEEFDLKNLVLEMFEIIEDRAQKRNISLVLDCPHDQKAVVYADHQRIGQVLKNLIVNAVIYGIEGGEVKVLLKIKEKHVTVSVIDNGPGISDEHQKRIFQRFYRVEKSRSKEMGGTGLGLSIVKHIVEAHDSTISLQSKLGKGATFTFKLKKLEE